MKITSLICILFFFSTMLHAQPGITVQDDAKVGFISTGTGANINVTQNFGKYPEYTEIKKRLDALNAAIAKKADKCDKYTDPVAKDDCRTELIALNAERDSVLKIETRFREDVIRLAETFSKISMNSERLRMAKALFDEGKIREADAVLNAKEMKAEGDALLGQKAREQENLRLTDSLLHVKANEFALKAQLKAADYNDPLRYDSAEIYFTQSLLYAEDVDNLCAFANLLISDNRSDRALPYCERALQLARSESEEASLSNNLGTVYFAIQKITEAENMYLHSLEIKERQAKSNPAQFEPSLALTMMNIGVFYQNIHQVPKAEKMYLCSLEIYERIAKFNPAQFEPSLALTMMNIGNFYSDIQRMPEAEKMYLRSLEKYEHLAKSKPSEFEFDLAKTLMNLGNYYSQVQKIPAAEKMYLRSLEIFERLAKSNPAQFEPGVAITLMNLGNFYYMVQRMPEAEKLYLRSLEIRERLAKSNPVQFELDLAITVMNLGNLYLNVQRMPEAEKMYVRSLEILERLAKSNPMQFEPDLSVTTTNLGNFYFKYQKMPEAESMYLRSLQIKERLAKYNPEQFEPSLALTAMNFGNFYLDVQRMSEAEKMYLRSLEIYERLAKHNPTQFEPNLALILNNIGFLRQTNGQFEEAKILYSHGLALRQKAVESGQVYQWDELIRVYSNMAYLCDSFAVKGNWPFVVAIQHERAVCMEALAAVQPAAAKKAPQDYGSLSWYCLFAKQYPEAQAAALRALALDPAQNWVRASHGHSNLLQGDWRTAKSVYEQYLKNEVDPVAAKTTLLKDLDDLEAAGITCAEVAKARAWLRE